MSTYFRFLDPTSRNLCQRYRYSGQPYKSPLHNAGFFAALFNSKRGNNPTSIIRGLVEKKRIEHPECVVICNNGEKFLFSVWCLGWEDSEAGLPTRNLPCSFSSERGTSGLLCPGDSEEVTLLLLISLWKSHSIIALHSVDNKLLTSKYRSISGHW